MARRYDPPTVLGIFFTQAGKKPDRILKLAKADGEWKPTTCREAVDAMRATSLGLVSLGVNPGDTVGIVSRTRMEWNDADYAILAAGGVTVAIYPTSTREQMRYIVGHAELRWAFAEDEEQAANLLAIRDETGFPEWIVVFDPHPDEGEPQVISLDDLKARGRALDDERPELFEERWRAVTQDDLATIAYTSGTTGPPKGVMITHGNLYHTVINASSVHTYTEDDFGVVFLPLAHLLQRFSVYAGLHLGVRGAYAESIDKLLDNFAELKPTVQVAVPRIFEKMHARILQRVEAGPPIRKKVFGWALSVGRQAAPYRMAGKSLPPALAAQHALAHRLVFRKIHDVFGGRVKYLISGGAPISVYLLEFFYAVGLTILEGYGLTETVAPATVNRQDRFRFGTVGQVIPGMEAKLANDGELLLRGKGLFRGYYKDEAATAEAIDERGWFATGDIAEIDEDGFIRITDRKKDLIVTAGGKNIPPQEIENRLKEHPLVSQALVHGDRRKFLTALITLDEEELAIVAKELDAGDPSTKQLTEHDEIKVRVDRHVQAVNGSLSRYETIKKYAILAEDFSLARGEITPTLKLKRKPITERYKDLLDSFYDESY